MSFIMNPCELPPCPPCPPPPAPPCPQFAPPKPLPPVCYPKPIMRGLHWTQTMGIIRNAFLASIIGGVLLHVFVAQRRREQYRDYYAKAELEDWADEMARKGLFQSVPAESLKDNQPKKK